MVSSAMRFARELELTGPIVGYQGGLIRSMPPNGSSRLGKLLVHTPLPADVVKGIRNGNFGFHDPVLNATFCYFASDSTDNGSMWVYRHRKAAAR